MTEKRPTRRVVIVSKDRHLSIRKYEGGKLVDYFGDIEEPVTTAIFPGVWNYTHKALVWVTDRVPMRPLRREPDGAELHSTEHPRAGFWTRLRNRFRRIRKDSVETVEIELPEKEATD